MQAQLETLSGLERRLSFTIPRAEISKRVDARLKDVAKKAKIAGFRPGKAPLNIVAQQHGFRVQEEVLGETVERSFGEAVQEQQLQVAGYPQFAPAEGSSEDGDFQFVATFEVYPEVKLGDLSGKEIEKPTLTVGDAEVDQTIEILRRQRTRFERVERAAQDEDRVIIDFKGTIDGEVFQGGSAENYAFLLGKGQMLADFENGIRGMKEGETKNVEVKFPEDYQGKEVAGKAAVFEITVKNVAAPQLPAVDADFAKALGIADGDVTKMRAEVQKNLEREVRLRLKARVKESVMSALIDSAPLDLPRALVGMEIGRLAEQAQADLKARGIDPKLVPFSPAMFEEQAKRRVHLGLVLADVVKANKLEAKPEQVKAIIEDLAENYEDPADVIAWYYEQRERLAGPESMALEDNVVDFVLGQAKSVEKVVAFDELMGQQG
ncbi:trigger factor [Chitiniphilus shinanonensis]|uniref:Trigger factor n=1 Tax=Chitiniphilus shinanonensis TaxID=553088 RepID=A0ABQ6BSE5_9NEIS|nr:trigger factor [Chitiniphilus shinanonensis]GLS04246.1 trigger factor [Chitiniphilus shinanonensis]